MASSFLSFAHSLLFICYIYPPKEKDYPEYQNVVFAPKGRTRVGKNGFFAWKDEIRVEN
jgi:hypothetical protein